MTLSKNILLLNTGNVHTHETCLLSALLFSAALTLSAYLCCSGQPSASLQYQPCSNLCCQHKLLSLTATNASNPKFRRASPVCEALQIYKCLHHFGSWCGGLNPYHNVEKMQMGINMFHQHVGKRLQQEEFLMKLSKHGLVKFIPYSPSWR